MRKYLPILVILGVFISSLALAETTILTGEVTKIEANSFTIVKNINWLERLTALLRKSQPQQPLTINVTGSTKFYLRTSQTAGFTEGSFSDLKEKDHVIVTADKTNDTYTASEVKITGRFIPSPKPKPPVPEIKQCQTDADCTWCGMSCVNKTELNDKACPQVMPKEGTECKCVFVLPPAGITPTTVTDPSGNVVPLPTYGVCKVVPSTSAPSTTLSKNTFHFKGLVMSGPAKEGGYSIEIVTCPNFEQKYITLTENTVIIGNNINKKYTPSDFRLFEMHDIVEIQGKIVNKEYIADEIRLLYHYDSRGVPG